MSARHLERVVPSCPSCLNPSTTQARSCPRSGFPGFQCRHPSRLPAIRVRAVAFGDSSHASLPRASRWGVTGKSHLPDVGDSFACFPLSLCALCGWNPFRIPPAICPPAGRTASCHSSLVTCHCARRALLFVFFTPPAIPFAPCRRAELSARHLERVVPSCPSCLLKKWPEIVVIV